MSVLQALEQEDFLYISIAYRFINIGFFSLAMNSVNMIDDTEIWGKQIALLKAKYNRT